MICYLLRCKSTSSSEHKDSSKEASEDKDSLSEASELSRTERSFSEHVGTKWVNEGTESDLSLPKTEELKRKGEREWLAMSEDGSEIETKRAGGFWVSIYNWVYNWALG